MATAGVRDHESVEVCTDGANSRVESVSSISTPIEGGVVEGCLSGGECRHYETYEQITADLVSGVVSRTSRARLVSGAGDGEDTGDTGDTGEQWSTVGDLVGSRPEIDALYRPIWSHTMKGLYYGVMAGIALKALDTTALLFSVDDRVGVVWLLVLGSLFVARWWWWAPLLVGFQTAKAGIGGNQFFTALAVGLVGAVLGGPPGMVVGTLIGRHRAARLPRAADAEPEGSETFSWGLVAPAIFFVVAASFYFGWVVPTVAAWMAEG